MTTISTRLGTLDLSKHIDPQFIETILTMGSWYVNTHSSAGYIVRKCNSTKKKQLLHRVVFEIANGSIPDNMQIDHIDCCRTNNFLCNLRLVTRQQNQWNRIQTKGYYWNTRAKKWRAKIKVDDKTTHLGSFKTEAEARQAYLDAKAIYHVIP